MQTPHVTVLTAVRNGSRYLPETIASIRAQTFRDWEYIIVDDASEDDTCRVVEAASRDDSRIRLIRRSKSEGPFAAANEGLSQARGRFVVRTDADDISPPHRIDRQLRFLNAERRFRACISPWQSFDERGLIAGSVNRIPSGADSLRWYLLLRTFSSHSSLCIERAALQEIGGYFELPVAQDYRLVCDLSRRGWLGVVPEVLSYVRRHENRISGRNGLLQKQLALDVMQTHLLEMKRSEWSRDDLEALWLTGQGSAPSLTTGSRILDRLESLWLSDPSITSAARSELARFAARHRWLLLHSSLRQAPLGCLRYAMKCVARNPSCLAEGMSYFGSIVRSRINSSKGGRRLPMPVWMAR